MRKSMLALVATLLFLGSTVFTQARATSITFDDGISGDQIDSFYASASITFQNATWFPNFVGTIYVNGDATAPLYFSSTSSGGFNSAADPIVLLFDSPQTQVEVLAVNIGFGGARIEAFDSTTGGSLVGSDQAVGVTEIGEMSIGGGFFENEEFLLSVTAPSISRVEFFRPIPSANDGIFFDNLAFQSTSVPTPSPFALVLTGLSIVVPIVRKRRQIA